MTTALVITTYNAPLDLRCTLLSVARQTVMPDEIIIADDGSREPTREMIESFRPIFGDRLVHVWQPGLPVVTYTQPCHSRRQVRLYNNDRW